MTRVFVLLASALLVSGCLPDLGPCDEARAKRLVYSDDGLGLPAFEGQALVDTSCGNGTFCHSANASGFDRHGVPAGLDLDVALANHDGLTQDAVMQRERTLVLQAGQAEVYERRYDIYSAVLARSMPPGRIGDEIVAQSRPYMGMPSVTSAEGREILRNWLSCGAPVVERTSEPLADLPVVGWWTPAMPSGACPVGMSDCGGTCVDLASDAQNCGACGESCTSGQSCVGSACVCGSTLSACPDGCVNLQSDFTNCGACGRVCGAGQVCYQGDCLTGGCPTNTTDCGSSCVDTSTDVGNCGRCGDACPGGTSCVASTCQCAASATIPTVQLCGSSCVDTATDPQNCGTCGNACPAGASCVPDPTGGHGCACPAGQTDLCANTCVDKLSDSANCGGCGIPCTFPTQCIGGSCSQVSFANDIQPIFTASCALSGCHTGARPAQGLRLTTGSSYAALVGVPSTECAARLMVAPSAPDQSYLVDKLLGLNLCRGNQMPKIGQFLPAAEIDRIRAWIAAGAPNN